MIFYNFCRNVKYFIDNCAYFGDCFVRSVPISRNSLSALFCPTGQTVLKSIVPQTNYTKIKFRPGQTILKQNVPSKTLNHAVCAARFGRNLGVSFWPET